MTGVGALCQTQMSKFGEVSHQTFAETFARMIHHQNQQKQSLQEARLPLVDSPPPGLIKASTRLSWADPATLETEAEDPKFKACMGYKVNSKSAERTL